MATYLKSCTLCQTDLTLVEGEWRCLRCWSRYQPRPTQALADDSFKHVVPLNPRLPETDRSSRPTLADLHRTVLRSALDSFQGSPGSR